MLSTGICRSSVDIDAISVGGLKLSTLLPLITKCFLEMKNKVVEVEGIRESVSYSSSAVK